jgi:hypothetical protein
MWGFFWGVYQLSIKKLYGEHMEGKMKELIISIYILIFDLLSKGKRKILTDR